MVDPTCSGEVWKAIPDHDYYEVSSLGRVRSLDRLVPGGRYPGSMRRMRGRVLAPGASKTGYLRVKLGTGPWYSVHGLVAAAFIGPRPEGMQVCHNDGDKLNNRRENLRYDTASENVRDSVRHGTQAMSRRTHCPDGHPYDERNTSWVSTTSGKGRQCRTCKRLRESARRAAKRASHTQVAK